jgi:hypothetical protein
MHFGQMRDCLNLEENFVGNVIEGTCFKVILISFIVG